MFEFLVCCSIKRPEGRRPPAFYSFGESHERVQRKRLLRAISMANFLLWLTAAPVITCVRRGQTDEMSGTTSYDSSWLDRGTSSSRF